MKRINEGTNRVTV